MSQPNNFIGRFVVKFLDQISFAYEYPYESSHWGPGFSRISSSVCRTFDYCPGSNSNWNFSYYASSGLLQGQLGSGYHCNVCSHPLYGNIGKICYSNPRIQFQREKMHVS